jgi:hypothetical protein
MESLREQLAKRLAALKAERQKFEPEWKDIVKYILPTRGRFDVGDTNKSKKTDVAAILDNEARLSMRTFVAGMTAGATSPARPWFQLAAPDPELTEYEPVKEWLFKVAKIMREIFAKSNVYKALPEIYKEIGGFGTACALVQDDYEDVIRVYPHTVGEYYIAINDRLVVDTLYRELPMTVAQVVHKFKIENVSRTVRSLYESGKVDAVVQVVHAIQPRDYAQCHHKAGSKAMPFVSAYYEVGADDQTLLRESGYEEFPGLTPRWETVGIDSYGNDCPGMMALPDVKSLQLKEKQLQIGIAKIVNPPMVGAPELQHEEKSTLPGGITYASFVGGAPAFRSVYDINLRINELDVNIEKGREKIRTAFFADLFQMLALSDRRQITAREIEERHAEKLLMLGPMLESLHNELLNPLIDRTFSRMVNAKILPPPPRELQGSELKVEYISILAQAQKAVGTAPIEQLLGLVANVAAVNPEALDKVDTDQVIDEYGNMIVLPPKLIRTDDEVRKIREQRAQQVAAQQGLAAAQQGADVAKTLSDTQVGDGNALDSLSSQVQDAGPGA